MVPHGAAWCSRCWKQTQALTSCCLSCCCHTCAASYLTGGYCAAWCCLVLQVLEADPGSHELLSELLLPHLCSFIPDSSSTFCCTK
jgi:hypothetical protein